eukprot:5772658-Pyramimonas_sp.AAC.1
MDCVQISILPVTAITTVTSAAQVAPCISAYTSRQFDAKALFARASSCVWFRRRLRVASACAAALTARRSALR